MTYLIAKWAAICTAFVLAVGFLVWAPSVYPGSMYLGTLLIFGAMTFFATSVLMLARGGRLMLRIHHFAWGMGATTALVYIVLLCLARSVGVGAYQGSWHWFDFLGLAFAAVYLAAYAFDLLRGGVEPVAYPVDYHSVWQAQQEVPQDVGAVSTYDAEGHRRYP